MKYVTALVLCLAAFPATAEEQKFTPFTIDEPAYRALMNFLGEVPSKYANPIISALDQKEREAMAKAGVDFESPRRDETRSDDRPARGKPAPAGDDRPRRRR